MLDAPIRSVAVVGGGIVGWSAAVALRRRVPRLEVTILGRSSRMARESRDLYSPAIACSVRHFAALA